MKDLSVAILLWALFLPFLSAQDSGSSPILFIYDASGSMWQKLGDDFKKEVAAELLANTVGKLPEDQAIGLMAYGHREKGNCEDVEMLVNMDNRSKAEVVSAVQSINPLGKTPLAYSATLAIDKLRNSGQKATIILITDGIESCDGDLCEVVAAAKKEGIDFKLHIIGFGLKDGDTEALRCAAEAGDGNYYDAADADGLDAGLQEATSETVDDPAGNFSLFAVKNGEPIDVWVRAYRAGTEEEVDVARTYRDTGQLYLPAGKYDLWVQPLENTDLSAQTISVSMQEDETAHRTISFDGATLMVTTTHNGEPWDAMVKVHDVRTDKVVAGARTYGRTKSIELDPGTYEVALQVLKVDGPGTQHRTTEIRIQAGDEQRLDHDFKSGTVRIGVQSADGRLIDATVGIYDASGKNIAGGRTYKSSSSNPREFFLSPWQYQVKVISLGKDKGYTETFPIEIVAGEAMEKIIVVK